MLQLNREQLEKLAEIGTREEEKALLNGIIHDQWARFLQGLVDHPRARWRWDDDYQHGGQSGNIAATGLVYSVNSKGHYGQATGLMLRFHSGATYFYHDSICYHGGKLWGFLHDGIITDGLVPYLYGAHRGSALLELLKSKGTCYKQVQPGTEAADKLLLSSRVDE